MLQILLYVAAWENGKKRKIGLTWMSYLTFFITPFLAFIVSLFSKRIDKNKKELSYEDRLPYENMTAMLIIAIMYLFVAAFFSIVAIVGATTEAYGGTVFGLYYSIIYIIWGCSLLKQRKRFLLVQKGIATNNTGFSQSTSSQQTSTFAPLFTFVSNLQQRITDNDYSEPAYSTRKVVVEHNSNGLYRASVIDTQNEQRIMDSVPMHKDSYSGIDECLSLKSDDGEYTLNIFYKDGRGDKCVIYRKSKDVYIHYCKE